MEVEILENSPGLRKLRFCKQGQVLSLQEVLEQLISNSDFQALMTQTLAKLPFGAVFWETPPMTEESLDRDFEFVAIDSPRLAQVKADRRAFAAHFGDEASVVSFTNLGGDAVLIAPCPVDGNSYPHLLAFLRTAPPWQTAHFWQKTAEETLRRINWKPVWLSTSGLGVYWLHVRLDSRPKYYQHQPYKYPPEP